MNKFIFILTTSGLLFSPAHAAELVFPDSYQASYNVTRGGKTLAEQQTHFSNINNNQISLTDSTKGTKGLAAFTGFERQEHTELNLLTNQVSAIKHNMKQSVAFKKKLYQFEASTHSDTISGKLKKTFQITSKTKPISSHLLSLWLSAKACAGETSFEVKVLKGKRIRTYEFNVSEEPNQQLKVERIYTPNTDKTSTVWLDKSQQCIPTRVIHQEAGEPTIETQLNHFEWQPEN